MIITSNFYEPSLGQIIKVETEIEVRFRSSVATFTDLPILDIAHGDAVFVSEINHLFVYVLDAWYDQGVYEINDLLIASLMQKLS